MSLETTLLYLYRTLVPNVDYVLVDNGAGAIIQTWSSTVTEPTATDISNAATAADLWWAQGQQVATLSSNCQAAIMAGFTSSATGASLVYTLGLNDQRNALSATIAANGAIQRATTWAASVAYVPNSVIVSGGLYYVTFLGGTSGTVAPTFPTDFVTTVTDNTALWIQLGWPIGTTTGNVLITAPQVIELFEQGDKLVADCRKQYMALKAQVMAATTVSAVQAVVW